MKGYEIKLQIYAENEQEAAAGRDALIQFIDTMRKCGVAVRGSKIRDAVNKLDNNQFIKGQIANFFR